MQFFLGSFLVLLLVGLFFGLVIGMFVAIDELIFDGKLRPKVKARIQKFFGVV